MRIIISPAKKMREDTEYYSYYDYPVFLQKTGILMDWIKTLPFSEQKKLWACNDKIAKQKHLQPDTAIFMTSGEILYTMKS